jgi:signal transduction histidine kinase
MRLLSSLRSRIFLASALLALLSIAVAIYLVSVRVTGELEASLHRQMAATRSLVEQLRTDRTRTFTMMARLIADAPKLKAAVDTNDPATVQNTANDYQVQLNSNLLLITSRTGQVLATVGASPRAAQIVANQPSIRDAIGGRESSTLIPQGDGILQTVTVPITESPRAPDRLGTLTVGFLLDDALASQLKQITGSDIAFGMDGQVLASTFPREARGDLARLLRTTTSAANTDVAGEPFVVDRLALDPRQDGESGPVALVLRSRIEQLQFLNAIHTELAVTAVVAVLLGTLLSFAVARTITRPLADITRVMREVAATGDLTKKIALRGRASWNDEDAQLLATTFNTLTESVARFQRAMSHRERLTSLGRLSTVIAHEVRNPLMIIKAALHTLRQPELTSAAIREAAADIDEEVSRLNRIVNEVLDFARPIRFELGTTDLNALCRESAAAAQATAGPPVRVDLDASVPAVMSDAERLRVALVNLLVNARQAVEASQPALSAELRLKTDAPPGAAMAAADGNGVILSTRRSGEGVTIVVSDTGAGIDVANLSHVFDPYFTTKRGGTGLGLPIAKNIVEGLGGTLTVASAPGRGTEMRIDLPSSSLAGADAHS